VLTTQYLEEADRLASRVAVVDHGRVIADDTPARLKAQLGSTVIEIGLADASTASRAHEALARSGSLSPELEDSTVRLTTHEGARLLVEAMRAFDGERIVPVTLTVREPSLDDVFLALTGHHAEAEAESEA
jgi:ABC-type multidrug transport system ATPase subunit